MMPESITVEIKDSSYLKIFCSYGVKDELSEFFKFFAPNYRFSPKYKNRLWDGCIRLFNKRDHTLPYGLWRLLLDFCKERGYQISLPENITKKENIDTDELKTFLRNLSFPDDIKPRDYQLKGLIKTIQKKRCTLVSATGSGKSLMIYMIERWHHYKNPKCKTLVIVPTVNLVNQLESNYDEYSINQTTKPSLQKIYSGQDKRVTSNVVISTWQSLQSLPEEFFEQFDVVIGDEAHGAKAKELTRILTLCKNAYTKIGMTGSLDGSKVNELVIVGLFGEVDRLTYSTDLMKKEQLAQLEIKCVILKYPEEERKLAKKLLYQDELSYIKAHRKRNSVVAKIATANKSKNTLLLFRYIEHGKLLFKMIQEHPEAAGRSVYFITGQTPSDERERIRIQAEKEKNCIIVASVGVFSTGVNIKNLEVVILGTPVKSRVTILQSIGRSLRIGRSDKAVFYDIADDISWKKYKNHTLRHFIQRLNIYMEEKFEHSITKISLEGKNDKSTTKTDLQVNCF